MNKRSSQKMLKMSIVLTLLALALSACGGSKDDNKESSPSASAEVSASVEASASAEISAEVEAEIEVEAELSVEAELTVEADLSVEADMITDTEVPAGYKLFEDRTYGTSFQYPEDWTVQENVDGALALFLSPKESESDKFQENVSVIVEDLGGEKVTLDQYAEVSKQQLGAVITDFNIVTEEKGTLEDGEESYNLLYSGKQGDHKLTWQQVYMIVEGNAFVITYTAEPASFDKFVEAAGSIVESWTSYE
ncbi:DcrB-related protein [Cohnella sp. WQ 127256]|uniref:DcrB-related protein n=1 Tax=Cohnella sp. WQ 127256 TaxID=2938790 RepID=UPI002117A60C|nr:DcrB-related protein [Cohnella sp. WQ 127256]